MENIINSITNFLYVILLVICVFITVHASLQIKNNQFSYTSKNVKTKKDLKKMKKIIVIAISIALCIYFKILNNISSFNANTSVIENYKTVIEELNYSLSLEFVTYKGGTYSSAQKIASFIENQLPIKSSYYFSSSYGDFDEISKYEILKYKLDDFVGKPTLVTYDGILISIIKFNKGCEYTNKRNIAKSDCIIEVDVNHYEEPNQIGQDRVLMAINGNTNEIIADTNFFKN